MPTPLRPAGLPDFDDPPLAEVVLDVTLDPLPLVRNAHLGVFWADELRADFPGLAERNPLAPQEERFGGDQPLFEFTFGPSPPVMRQWYISEDDTRLLQVQQDRFIHNWRRRPEGEYPRYEALRAAFERYFTTYATFLDDHGLGHPSVRQTEITYINRLEPDGVWHNQRELDRILRSWSPDFGTENLLTDPIEEVRLAWRHIITDEAGPYARLYVSVEPGGGGVLVLQLTVRGKPRGGSLKAALAFFDMGRERIVQAFTAITTDEMHLRWGRRLT